MTAYFVASNGAQTGPFTIEQIRTRCASGEIQRQTLMWRDGLAEWQSAESVLRDEGVVFGAEVQSPRPPPLSDDRIAPAAAAAADSGPRFGVPGASVAAGRGIHWISEGWRLFAAAPGMWIVAMLLWLGIQAVLGFVPFLGSLASLLLGPSFVVGLLAFAHGIAHGGKAELGALFVGFKDKLGPLIVLALLYFVMILGIILVVGGLAVALLGGTQLFHAGNLEQTLDAVLSGGGLLIIVLLVLVLVVLIALVASAYWYAPGLVFFADQSAGAAMKQSFNACLRNWLPLLIYGLIAVLISIIGALPLGLGLLVVIPVLMASSYASFRDIFGQED